LDNVHFAATAHDANGISQPALVALDKWFGAALPVDFILSGERNHGRSFPALAAAYALL
jgi:hypothetical protein